MSTENNNEPEYETPVEDPQVINESSESAAEKPASNSSRYTLGMLCHLLSFCAYIFPFGNLVGPLILWLVKRDEDPFLNESGKEVLNFQISLTIYAFISGLLVFAFGLGIILLIIIGVASIILTIIAAIKANEGIVYQYPFSIRLIK